MADEFDPALLPQVKYEYGKASFEKLKAAGANADFKTYKYLQHGVDPQEVQVGQLCVCTHSPGCTGQEDA